MKKVVTLFFALVALNAFSQRLQYDTYQEKELCMFGMFAKEHSKYGEVQTGIYYVEFEFGNWISIYVKNNSGKILRAYKNILALRLNLDNMETEDPSINISIMKKGEKGDGDMIDIGVNRADSMSWGNTYEKGILSDDGDQLFFSHEFDCKVQKDNTALLNKNKHNLNEILRNMWNYRGKTFIKEDSLNPLIEQLDKEQNGK